MKFNRTIPAGQAESLLSDTITQSTKMNEQHSTAVAANNYNNLSIFQQNKL